MSRNRPSDLSDQRRNSFGLVFPNHVFILGTKGDVETFFYVLNDLISEGVIDDRYKTISHDLYRTLINEDNLDRFKDELGALKIVYSRILSNQIKWERYPFNRIKGEFDYQNICVDINKMTLLNVFERFFAAFDKSPFWIEESISRGGKYSRMVISPTEIRTDRIFRRFSNDQFLQSADDPLWLREPA